MSGVTSGKLRRPRTGKLAKRGALERVERRRSDALKLRTAGASFRAIGAQLGISAMQAFRDIESALGEIVEMRRESAEALRALELERMDRLTTALWPKASAGDDAAARTLVRISERRCRLLGLDAETRQRLEISGHTTTAVVEREHREISTAELERQLRSVGQRLALAANLPEVPEAVAPGVVTIAAPVEPFLTPEDRYRSLLAERRNGGGSRPS